MSLIRIVKRIAKKDRNRNHVERVTGDPQLHVIHHHHHHHHYHTKNVRDDSSSMETASNNPGPGRLLGKIYMSLGRKVERLLSNMADRAGYGPAAVYRELMRIHGNDAFCYSDGELDEDRMPDSVKLHYTRQCGRLLSYTQLRRVIIIAHYPEI